MNLLQYFQEFIHQQGLVHKGDRILLAVSGGVDSMVMTHLFVQAKLEVGLAHCNFQLRGQESTEDEAFLRAWAQALGLPFYGTAFPTEQLAKEKRTSIQLLARELRYTWLEEIRAAHNFMAIATAHHLNDSIETFLYNFTKGTGLAGLQGIPMSHGKVIRPLLFASKADIVVYAQQEGISFREDSSNAGDKYARNQIRHHVVPRLQAINPAFESTAARNFSILQESYQLYRESVERFKSEWVKKKDKQVFIKKAGLEKQPHTQRTLLFECIREAGFHPYQLDKILHQLVIGKTGAIFYTQSHRLLVDREDLILDVLTTVDDTFQTISISRETQMVALSEGMLIFEWKNGRPDSFASPDQAAYFDADSILFPLTLRKWKAGDAFCPLGMKGQHQKLQDFFSNNGFTRFEKEKVWLLVDAEDNIFWIVGYRTDERFKIKENTNSFLEITIKKDNL